jgi:hypothetical protein
MLPERCKTPDIGIRGIFQGGVGQRPPGRARARLAPAKLIDGNLTRHAGPRSDRNQHTGILYKRQNARLEEGQRRQSCGTVAAGTAAGGLLLKTLTVWPKKSYITRLDTGSVAFFSRAGDLHFDSVLHLQRHNLVTGKGELWKSV